MKRSSLICTSVAPLLLCACSEKKVELARPEPIRTVQDKPKDDDQTLPPIILRAQRKEIQVRKWPDLKENPFVFEVFGREAKSVTLTLIDTECSHHFEVYKSQIRTVTDSGPGTERCDLKLRGMTASGATAELDFVVIIVPEPAPMLTVSEETLRGIVSDEAGAFEFLLTGGGHLELTASSCPNTFVVNGMRLVPASASILAGPRKCSYTVVGSAGGVKSNPLTVHLELSANTDPLRFSPDRIARNLGNWADATALRPALLGYGGGTAVPTVVSNGCPDEFEMVDGSIVPRIRQGMVREEKTCEILLSAQNRLGEKATLTITQTLKPPAGLVLHAEPQSMEAVELADLQPVRLKLNGPGSDDAKIQIADATPECRTWFRVAGRSLQAAPPQGVRIVGPQTCQLTLVAVSPQNAPSQSVVVTAVLKAPPPVSLSASPSFQTVGPDLRAQPVELDARGYGSPLSLFVRSSSCDSPLFRIVGNQLRVVAEQWPGAQTCRLELGVRDVLEREASAPVTIDFFKKPLALSISSAKQTLAEPADFIPMELTVANALNPQNVTFEIRNQTCADFFSVAGNAIAIRDLQRGLNCSAQVVAREGNELSPEQTIQVRTTAGAFAVRLAQTALLLKPGSPAQEVPIQLENAPGTSVFFERLDTTDYQAPCVRAGVFNVDPGKMIVRVLVPQGMAPQSCELEFRAVAGEVRSPSVRLRLEIGTPDKTIADYCKDAATAADTRAAIEKVRAQVSRKGHFLEPANCDQIHSQLETSAFWRHLRFPGIGLKDFSLFRSLRATEDLDLSDNRLTGITLPADWDRLRTVRLSNNPQLKDIVVEKTIPSVRILHLDGTGVKSLAFLKNFPNLETLTLPETGADLAVLRELGKLRHLHASGLALTDTALAQIGALTTLETLSLRQCHLQSIEPLAALTRLKILNLEQNTLRNVEPLASLGALEGLFMAKNPLRSTQGMEGLAKLKVMNLPESLACPAHLGRTTTQSGTRFCTWSR